MISSEGQAVERRKFWCVKVSGIQSQVFKPVVRTIKEFHTYYDKQSKYENFCKMKSMHISRLCYNFFLFMKLYQSV